MSPYLTHKPSLAIALQASSCRAKGKKKETYIQKNNAYTEGEISIFIHIGVSWWNVEKNMLPRIGFLGTMITPRRDQLITTQPVESP